MVNIAFGWVAIPQEPRNDILLLKKKTTDKNCSQIGKRDMVLYNLRTSFEDGRVQRD